MTDKLSTEEARAVVWQDLVANAILSRDELFSKFADPRRNVDRECGYPAANEMTAQRFKDLYDYFAIATRVVEVLPFESWQVTPTVFEDEDVEVETEFERSWADLCRSLRGKSWHQDEEGNVVWEYLRRADVLSGIGYFGLLLLGVDDGKPLDQPIDGVEQAFEMRTTGMSPIGTEAQYQPVTFAPAATAVPGRGSQRRLLFIRAFDESLVQITQYEARTESPRFGQPVMYQVTLNDPRDQHSGVGLPVATANVHWTRVIHLADNLNSSEIFGVPRQRPVIKNLMDLLKLYGGSAEMYWQGAFPGISFETHPQLGGDITVDPAELRTSVGNYFNHLQRYLFATGLSAKTLAPQVVDPSSQISVQLEAICIKLGIPVRVFKGSERGELASSQDDASWNDRLRDRQNKYITPRVIVPFIDRLITIGIIPEPTGYSVVWPDLDSLTDKDKATIAFQRTQALAAYVAGNVEAIMELPDWYVRVLGLTHEEATAVITSKQDALLEEAEGGERYTPDASAAPAQSSGWGGKSADQGGESESEAAAAQSAGDE